MEHNPTKIPSPLLSLVPILVLVTFLFVTIRTFGSDALSGGSQIVLLTATAVCCLIAMTYSKVRWKALELAMINNITGVATALIILLIIGALSGSWMISGVVPSLIYYGIQVIHPDFFLVSTCLICAVVSVMTGSSWTTIATIGIALLGIGQAQGFSDGWTAGAIISGAYFGDKISPLSDTTLLASSVTDTPLFKHIRYMMITTVPSMLITLVIFTVAGLSHEATATDQIGQYSIALDSTFHITPVAADRTGRHRHIDCQKGAVDHHAIHLGGTGGRVRTDLPASSITKDFRFAGGKYPIRFQRLVNDILR